MNTHPMYRLRIDLLSFLDRHLDHVQSLGREFDVIFHLAGLAHDTSESSFSETNCDDCFQSINCTTNECKSVCNLDLCKNSGDDCSVETNTSIVDLYKSLFLV